MYGAERVLAGPGSTPSVSCSRHTSLVQRPTASAVTAMLPRANAHQATSKSARIRNTLLYAGQFQESPTQGASSPDGVTDHSIATAPEVGWRIPAKWWEKESSSVHRR
jgi:hypothetical protein